MSTKKIIPLKLDTPKTEIINEENIKETNKEFVISNSKKILNLEQIELNFLFKYIISESEENIIIAMTPLGDIIGIKSKNELIKLNTTIKIHRVQGLSEISQAWLTNIAYKTDIATIVICKSGICLLVKNNLGKIETTYFKNNNEKNSNTTIPELPTAYPLLNLDDILNSYSTDNIVTPTKYLQFLNQIKNEFNILNKEQIQQKISELDNNINFMKSLIENIIENKNKLIEFVKINEIEIEKYSKEAEELLIQKMTSKQFNDIQKFKQNQEKLSELMMNNIIISNNIKNYNKFRQILEDLDRQTINFYFCLYSRILATMETSLRLPSEWHLESVLITTYHFLLENKNPTIEEINNHIHDDLSNYNPLLHNDKTNIIVSHFKNCFFI